MKPKVLFVIGTRPEAIKLAPVVKSFHRHSQFSPVVWLSGQHREMVEHILPLFGLKTDLDLKLMSSNQTLSALTSRAIARFSEEIEELKPLFLGVQGDTTTAFTAALAAFYHRIPVVHVEAGLRTGDIYSPFPEEANRSFISRITALHFTPTEAAAMNLISEGFSREKIHVVGNTVIDALLDVLPQVRKSEPELPEIEHVMRSSKRIVLITGHRRENLGRGFEGICTALKELASRFPEVFFIYPVHLNPNVRSQVFDLIAPSPRNLYLIQPVDYLQFVRLMDRCTLILTDSGGVQEEAPSMRKPVIVLRETTERPEAVAVGAASVAGTDAKSIVNLATTLLTDEDAYNRMIVEHNPFGDGNASERIHSVCVRTFKPS